MAGTLRRFTDADMTALKEVVAAFRKGTLTTRNRPWQPDGIQPSAKMYVVRVPELGIPALSTGANQGTGTSTAETDDDVPGSRDNCPVYQKINGVMKAIPNLLITVNNLADIAVPAGRWVPVFQDAFGDWYVANQGLEFAGC